MWWICCEYDEIEIEIDAEYHLRFQIGSFTPLLKVLSIRMHLSEQVAGCTLLVFGNSAPDLVSNLMPVRTMSKMFTSTVSSCVVEMLLCGGMACYMKPFRIDGHSLVRDLLFLMLGLELLRLIMYTGHSISLSECLGKGEILPTVSLISSLSYSISECLCDLSAGHHSRS